MTKIKREPCCFIGCRKEARFEIYGNESRSPDEATASCADHVGELLGTSKADVDRGIENRSWTVVFIR